MRTLRNLFLISSLTILASCSTLTELGIKAAQEKISTGNYSPVTRSDFASQRTDTVNFNSIPWWILIICLLFWQLPSPGQMGAWVSKQTEKIFKRDTKDKQKGAT